ncbi:helix-turn-helix domain-containing protein [Rhodococcus jostii]|uniref:helix-turn-helix domain-containing protein n=1 Tax=Rhodococcus jostii TaxID=132919 RepID=UPI0036504BF5
MVELQAASRVADSSPVEAVLFPALVTGERGTGRSTVARALVDGTPIVLDATESVENPVAFTAALRQALVGSRPLIVEDAHFLPTSVLVTMLRKVQRNRIPVVFTLASNEASEEASSTLAGGTLHRVTLEPLRRRRHEIPEIAARMLATAPGGAFRGLAPDAIRVLSSQSWPGNLTELRRVVELMAAIPGTGSLQAVDIPASHRKPASLPTPRAEAERDIIVGALHSAGGNRSRAAELLGVSRSTLYNRLRALQIEA